MRSFLRLICLFIMGLIIFAFASTYVFASDVSLNKDSGEFVTLQGHKVFKIYAPIGNFSTKMRSKIVSEKIQHFASDPSFDLNLITVKDRKDYSTVVANKETIVLVTNEDAKISGESRIMLAYENAYKIQQAIQIYRHENNLKFVVFNIGYMIVATLLLFLLVRAVNFFISKLIVKIVLKKQYAESRHSRMLNILPFESIYKIVISAVSFLRLIMKVIFAYFYLIFTMGLFSWGREFSDTLRENLVSALQNIGSALISYIPSLLFILLATLLAKFFLDVTKQIFISIENEKIKITGFYKEWARPTLRIVQFFICTLLLAIVFPYLPGADTNAFKGVSVFVGALITFGSSSSIASVVSGIIITYTRAFNVGDMLSISGNFGEVIEKNLLVTRIRTPKKEVISIPNSIVLSNHVVNYSQAKEPGILVYTKITIGYSTPWKIVEDLLISAALNTDFIKSDPAPFVLQSKLDNYYVAYEINAYTDRPDIMPLIYSALHRNIQDKFNEAKVEIMSPAYGAIRDGNSIEIPKEYIDSGYLAPKFNLHLDNKPDE